jgi:diaminopimelate epimerase
VEGETLACASGTISSAFALAREGLAKLPIRFRAGSGAILSVAGQVVAGEAQEVWLCGEGRMVFTGSWEG